MKKGVEKAFAIALFIISIISTIFPTNHIESITYAVIVPSFILSLTSFISEISKKCQDDAEKIAEAAHKLSNLEHESADRDYTLYNEGKYSTQYIDGQVPKEIFDKMSDSLEHMRDAVIYKRMEIFFFKFKNICDKLVVLGYILLFISLCLSPYISHWLSVINLNCITLWSLTLLYVTLELKSDITSKLYMLIYKTFRKKAENEIDAKTQHE
ncbi:MAG: hypothetical protein E7526_01340 [Ruminococcaceae bacterium]|nr:hypothetical protein [Oscillospiraceae bacterium]